ncbi:MULTISPECIES: DUF3068 domain-containing protein [unclassified Streptomyces]|uniref:DUF3068 domain-containing protein n=1 Tax=unclassified Streptomyces TaxID=2593676 RepID=UPI0023650658|nr:MULTISPECIES: DUF3068 domain-containing protein [unclassified Streptomyces]MDF3147543.1 DUF3068 domain-containing protein [Streptomyces sp. T21Q-yed]WDF35473.1 DUF3068 domain-containing protein [Streptomyces sp. T12]
MRRTASVLPLILIGLGVFALVFGQLLDRYVEPRVKRTPVDVETDSVLTGTGSFFDTGALETVHGKQITITRRVVGDVAASERSGNAVWNVSTQIDTPTTLPLRDPRRSLQWTTERWVTDRRTNLPVHCCGEQPSFRGDAYLKFPFDVQKRTYQWWDGVLGGAVPLKFSGSEKVLGREGYRFTGAVQARRTGVTREVPGSLVGRPKQRQVAAEEWYANAGIELVVEQRTGRIMNARIAPRITLRAPGARSDAVTLLASDRVEFTEATRRTQVAQAARDSRRLEVLGETAPTLAGVAGGVLTAAGLTFLVRERRRRAVPEDSQTVDRTHTGD